jgi:prophage regulatory protein
LDTERIADLPEYLGTAHLELITGVKAATWRWFEHQDKMPAGFPPSFKIGRRRVWPKAAVIAWLAEQQEKAAAQVAIGAATG